MGRLCEKCCSGEQADEGSETGTHPRVAMCGKMLSQSLRGHGQRSDGGGLTCKGARRQGGCNLNSSRFFHSPYPVLSPVSLAPTILQTQTQPQGPHFPWGAPRNHSDPPGGLLGSSPLPGLLPLLPASFTLDILHCQPGSIKVQLQVTPL